MTKQHVLIIDDEPDIRELLEITLIRMGLNTSCAATIEDAHEMLKLQNFDLCLTDMNLPDGSGIDLVTHIQNEHPNTPVAMITAYGNVETAISALKAGAFDFLSKPVDLKQLRDLISSALSLSSQSKQTTQTTKEPANPIMGNAECIKQLNNQILKLARSQAPIYISGESGSGKELVAKNIHLQGPRAHKGPFVPVNCGAIPSELVESEFFGHKKGSFSGAIEDKPGLFRAAHGGTLFLDEVADLPLSMQVKLLRAIQEKSIRPVGEQTEIPVDVRILSATHKDLEKLVEEGIFRKDLYYRINVIKLDVPSLRSRKEDISLLANYFLLDIAKECGVENASIHSRALHALSQYDFPGNVRELQNIIERAFTLCEGNIIHDLDLSLSSEHTNTDRNNDLATSELTSTNTDSSNKAGFTENEPATPPPRIVSELIPKVKFSQSEASHSKAESPRRFEARSPEQSLEDYLESIERNEIEQALQQTKWNRTASAKLLGMSFRALRYRLKKLGID